MKKLFAFGLFVFPVLLFSAVVLAEPAPDISTHAHVQAQETETMTELDHELIADIRSATVDFHQVDAATEAGYESFLDCMSDPEEGGMGQHYVQGDLVQDDVIDPLQPEALVYEPLEDGKMALIGFEYIVFKEAWDPNDEGREPPTLMGQEFGLVENLADLPPFYALHLWVWNYNPSGPFARYSPNVFCPEMQESSS